MIADATDVAQGRHGLRGVSKQGLFECRVAPGLSDDSGAVAWSDPGLVGLDNGIERGRIDIALFGQHGFQRAHSQLGFRKLGMVVVVLGHVPTIKQKVRLCAIIGGMSVAHMAALADRIDRLTSGVGRAVAWLILVVVGLQFTLVVARYLFGLGSVWLTETVIYAHATLFMLAAAWTLLAGGHVRVDLFYADASARTKAMVDLIGALLLLLPFILVLIWLSVPYAARSWVILEHSQEASGLPIVFVLKSLIPVFAVLMALQGISQAIRAAAALSRAR